MTARSNSDRRSRRGSWARPGTSSTRAAAFGAATLILGGSLVETVPGYAHVIAARNGAIRSLNRAVTKRFDGGGHDTWQLGIIGCVASFLAVHSIGLRGATSATALVVAGIIQFDTKGRGGEFAAGS